MNDDVSSPTLEQFLAAARAEFAFLAEHGFREGSPSNSGTPNPYVVLFERGDWRLRVEGLSYGVSASLMVIAPDGRQAAFGFVVPESFRKAREGLGRGQLGDLRYEALCFRTFGSAFLSDEALVFETMERHKQLASERDRAYWAQRDMEIAISKATKAFRAKQYADVVRLLSPFGPTLPRAQAAKLEVAKRRSP